MFLRSKNILYLIFLSFSKYSNIGKKEKRKIYKKKKEKNMNWNNIITTLVIVILTGLVIKLKFFNTELYSDSQLKYYGDTLYQVKPYIPAPELKIKEPPKVVIFFDKHIDTVKTTVDSIIHIRDTVRLITKPGTIDYHTNFLVQYPRSSKLLELNLDNQYLKLSLLNPEGVIYEEVYETDTYRNHYRYVNQSLTHQTNPFKFSMLAGYSIRPLTNMHDLQVLLFYKTTKIYYVGGISLSYYPKVSSNLHLSPFISVYYKI